MSEDLTEKTDNLIDKLYDPCEKLVDLGENLVAKGISWILEIQERNKGENDDA